MSSPQIHSSAAFDHAWQLASAVPGWLTRAQAAALWNAARALREGSCVLEIGSHQGRSTLMLAMAVQDTNGRVHAVDPFVEGRLFGGGSTRQRFVQNVADAELEAVVELHPEFSGRLRPSWHTPLDLLYVDGKHDYWTVRDDLRWGALLSPGGQMLVHDCFSSVGVTLGVLVSVALASEWVYLGRTGSLGLFRRGRPTSADRARVVAELPWFARNVGIKVLLRLRLGTVARRLGHQGDADPY